MSDESSDQSGLSQHLLKTLFKQAQENRNDAEDKWARNRAAREADPDIDPNGTWKKGEHEAAWKSGTMFDITRQKCMAAYSLIVDQILKNGLSYILAPKDEGEKTEALEADPTARDMLQDSIEHAKALIDRQLDNCDAEAQFEKVVNTDVTYGRTWIHSYITEMVDTSFVEVAPGLFDPIEMVTDTKAFEHVPIREMYWDMESDDAVNGEYLFRHQNITPAAAKKLTSHPYALPEQIEKAIKAAKESEGTGGTADTESTKESHLALPNRRKTVRKIECYALVPRNVVERFEREYVKKSTTAGEDIQSGLQQNDEDLTDMVEVYAITLNDYVCAYLPNPGPRPYATEVWETADEDPVGRGVADNCEPSQKVLNGAIRSMEDNAKLLSNFIVAVQRRKLITQPEEVLGKEGGVIEVDEGVEDVRQAITQMQFSDVLGPIMKVIELFLSFSDMSSGVPRAEQGQQSSNPQTAFELQQRLEKSSKYIGSAIKRLDRLVTWIIREFYDYNMRNPNLTEGKGDFIVKATGYGSFENRVLRLQKFLQLLNIIISSPELASIAKLKWLLEEIAKAMDIEPDQLVKTEDEMAQEQQAQVESEERQLAIEEQRGKVLSLQAKANLDNAKADQAAHSMEMDESKNRRENATAVVDIEDKVIQRNKPEPKPERGNAQ